MFRNVELVLAFIAVSLIPEATYAGGIIQPNSTDPILRNVPLDQRRSLPLDTSPTAATVPGTVTVMMHRPYVKGAPVIEMRVPKEYFPKAPDKPVVNIGFAVRAFYPDLRGLYSKESPQPDYARCRDPMTIEMMNYSRSDHTAMPDSVTLASAMAKNALEGRPAGALKTAEPIGVFNKVETATVHLKPSGTVVTNFYSKLDIHGRVTEFVECVANVPCPSCQEFFNSPKHPGLSVHVYFPSKDQNMTLAQWPRIRSSVESLVDNFYVTTIPSNTAN